MKIFHFRLNRKNSFFQIDLATRALSQHLLRVNGASLSIFENNFKNQHNSDIKEVLRKLHNHGN